MYRVELHIPDELIQEGIGRGSEWGRPRNISDAMHAATGQRGVDGLLTYLDRINISVDRSLPAIRALIALEQAGFPLSIESMRDIRTLTYSVAITADTSISRIQTVRLDMYAGVVGGMYHTRNREAIDPSSYVRVAPFNSPVETEHILPDVFRKPEGIKRATTVVKSDKKRRMKFEIDFNKRGEPPTPSKE